MESSLYVRVFHATPPAEILWQIAVQSLETHTPCQIKFLFELAGDQAGLL
jgi:hypothetical protein